MRRRATGRVAFVLWLGRRVGRDGAPGTWTGIPCPVGVRPPLRDVDDEGLRLGGVLNAPLFLLLLLLLFAIINNLRFF